MIDFMIMTALGAPLVVGQPRQIDPGPQAVIVCPGDPRCPAPVDPTDAGGPGNGTDMTGNASGDRPGTRADFLASIPSDRVLFDTNSHVITPEARAVLDVQARWLRDNPQVSVTIEGHADQRGTREDNLALGQRRAEATRQYLEANGIAAARMQVISWGKERPEALGEGADIDRRNRRAVLVVPE